MILAGEVETAFRLVDINEFPDGGETIRTIDQRMQAGDRLLRLLRRDVEVAEHGQHGLDDRAGRAAGALVGGEGVRIVAEDAVEAARRKALLAVEDIRVRARQGAQS